jgi:3-hydroxyisobutyrate dehydrogenase-like beta-hydroxyacid dehydrogenase
VLARLVVPCGGALTNMSRRTRKNVGLIGLGIIGSRLRDVLRRKGFHVFVWNRTPKPVPNFVGAPAELAEMCDVIQIFVSDDDALLDVVRQLAPGLGPRHIVVANSTVAPHTMVSACEVVTRRGARFLEAPFTGSKEAAEQGQLVYYVGGDAEAVKEARPALEATSKELMVIGDTIGQATTIKIATNMVTAASVQAAAEALALVQHAGVPLDKFAAAMQENASNSKTLQLKIPKMMERNYEPHFSVKHMLKDMQIASRIGLSHHLELGVTSAGRDRLLEQMQRGHGDDDYAAIARKYFADKENIPNPTDLDLFNPNAAAPLPEPAWVDLTPPPQPIEFAPASVVDQAAPVQSPNEIPLAPQSAPMAEPSAPISMEELPIEPVEEEEPERRGFLGRLLRRESNG